MTTPYELTIVPYNEYTNRIDSPHRRDYDFTYQGCPGVKLTNALAFRQSSYSVDHGGDSMIYDGAKFEYRLTITGRTSRHRQQHATRTVRKEKETILMWKAAKQAASFVSDDLKAEPLFAPDGRRLHFDDLYLCQLKQQGASLLVILAYYNVPQMNAVATTASPLAAAPLPPPPPSPPIIPMGWHTTSYALEPTPQALSSQPLVWNGYPSASVPRSMYGPLTVIADPGLYGTIQSSSLSTAYTNPSPSSSYDAPPYSTTESTPYVQQSSSAGHTADDWWMYEALDNQAGPSYSYGF